MGLAAGLFFQAFNRKRDFYTADDAAKVTANFRINSSMSAGSDARSQFAFCHGMDKPDARTVQGLAMERQTAFKIRRVVAPGKKFLFLHPI